MPTTFTVIQLGNAADIDPVEGNDIAENASALVGQTFGGVGDPLLAHQATLEPTYRWGRPGYDAGFFWWDYPDDPNAYDTDTPSSPLFQETFLIDGQQQTFDSVAVYDATITYTDGTTADITAVVFQDTNGNLYWAPEIDANADQAAMEAKPIRSLTLNAVSTNSGDMAASRQSWNVLVCFAAGTRIATPEGPRPVERVRPGELVQTLDHGPRPVRWVGQATVLGLGRFAPVRINPDALAPGVPERPLLVSRQHRILVRGRIAERVAGEPEVLVPAIRLVGLPGVEEAPTPAPVTYVHLLLDAHEVLVAEGAPAESLYPGPMAREMLGPEAVAEIEALFPGLLERIAERPARALVAGRKAKAIARRHARHQRALLQG